MHAMLSALGEAQLRSWLAAWPDGQGPHGISAADAPPARHTLRVLEWLPRAARAAPSFSAPLCTMLCQAAPDLEWRQTYTQADVLSGAIEAAFLDHYGWCEVLGPRAATRSDGMASGFLLLGPQTHYPSHRHESEELYLPLSGTAWWWQGAGEGQWQQRQPGALIHHASFEPHAMRTDDDPLLALYIWRGGNVHTKAAFLPS